MTNIEHEAAELSQTSLSHWQTYSEYKVLNIEWFGEIPTHWKIFSLQRVVKKFVDYRGHTPQKVESGVTLITAANIKNGFIDLESSQQFIPDDLYVDWMVRGFPELGDVILTTEAPLGEVAQITDISVAIAQRLILFKADKRLITNEYLKYYFLADSGKGELQSRATGSTAVGIKASRLKQISVLVPSIEEQGAIAIFLDRETAEIDALIAKKRELINLLQERRSALIGHAVTKGLNPDASLKDSGIQWVGYIPIHWESPKLKWAARLESGHTPSRQVPEYWVNCTIPWVSLSDVSKFRDDSTEIIFETSEMVSELGLANSAARLLPADTVILSRTASVGFSAILGRPMATTQDFVNWICYDDLLPSYLLYCFRAMRHEFNRLTMGSTHQTIYMPDVARFAIPLPPKHEQIEIVNHIRQETKVIDTLISKTEETVTRLQEYRSALISAAVTGKIDVRGEV